jgi:hypothetical protein
MSKNISLYSYFFKKDKVNAREILIKNSEFIRGIEEKKKLLNNQKKANESDKI